MKLPPNHLLALVALALCTVCPLLARAEPPSAPSDAAPAPWKALEDGRFSWTASSPLVGPDREAADPHISIKDPTVVRHGDRWHLFCTVRMKSGKVDIEYLNFADWKDAARAPRHSLNLHDQYYCAPEVFYFRPQRRWYLVFQMADKAHKPPFGPAYSTTTTLDDPKSWSKPRYLLAEWPKGRRWLDFWVIADEAKAHLFYTSLNGRFWHASTRLADFPRGWSEPELAIQGDIFEASHTYRLRGLDKYLTLVEAQGGGRRYYKAYLADRLDGPWKGLADTRQRPFAGYANVKQDPEWTANISHGELLRAGHDERLEVDPARLRFLFQGASDREYHQKYGLIPWRLGILEPAR